MACRPYNTGRCLLLRLFNPSKLWGSLQSCPCVSDGEDFIFCPSFDAVFAVHINIYNIGTIGINRIITINLRRATNNDCLFSSSACFNFSSITTIIISYLFYLHYYIPYLFQKLDFRQSPMFLSHFLLSKSVRYRYLCDTVPVPVTP